MRSAAAERCSRGRELFFRQRPFPLFSPPSERERSRFDVGKSEACIVGERKMQSWEHDTELHKQQKKKKEKKRKGIKGLCYCTRVPSSLGHLSFRGRGSVRGFGTDGFKKSMKITLMALVVRIRDI